MILFKNHFAINRDMSEMFKRFQVGRRYFGNEEEESRIFQVTFLVDYNNELNWFMFGKMANTEYHIQALFCMIIKDVPEADTELIQHEFYQKLTDIVQAVCIADN